MERSGEESRDAPWEESGYVTIFSPLVWEAASMPMPLVSFVKPADFIVVIAWPARFPEWQ